MIIFTFYGGWSVVWIEVVQLGIYIAGAAARRSCWRDNPRRFRSIALARLRQIRLFDFASTPPRLHLLAGLFAAAF